MTQLQRRLGLPSLTFFGVGMVLGAGIYSVVGAAAAEAGEALWQSFLLAAVAALFTGLSYAELAAMHPRAGGEFVYVRKAFPRQQSLALICGVVIVLAASATGATVALAFGGYLAEVAPLPVLLSALLVVVLATAVNVLGIRESTWLNVAFTLLEVSGLVLVIVLGMGEERFGEALRAKPHAGLLPAAGLIFFAYLGFEDIVNLSEEARRPERNVPRAILASVAITAVLYVLVALAVVALTEASELGDSSSPLAEAAAAASPRMARALVPLALFATANTALATLITASRMTYGMAKDGALPDGLARVLKTRQTPWIACLLVGAIAALLLPLGGVALVAGMSSFGALLAFALVNLAAIVLRYRDPDRKRPFRVPGAVGRMPIVPLLGLTSSCALLTSFDKAVYVGGAGTVALAAGVVLLRRKAWRAA